MFGLGAQELIVIAILAVVLLFGATRIPKLGRSMGQSIRGFKQGLKEDLPPGDDKASITSKSDDSTGDGPSTPGNEPDA